MDIRAGIDFGGVIVNNRMTEEQCSFQEWLGMDTTQTIKPNPFVFDGQSFGSVEALAQVIQLPEDDPRRPSIAMLDTQEARSTRRQLREGRGRAEYIYWNGQSIQTGSDEHRGLMRRAVGAFKKSNPTWDDIRPKRPVLLRPPRRRRPSRQLPERNELEINVGVDPESDLLSNFAHTPFELDGKHFASVEAFVQYIKYPDGDSYREQIPELVGRPAYPLRGRNQPLIGDCRSDLTA